MSKPARIEEIYGDFKQVVFEKPMRPGQRIDVEALSKHYGVSTMPILMLLNRVVGEGVLEVSPHQGYIVPGATGQRVRDVHTWNKQVLMLALETAMDSDVSTGFPELRIDPNVLGVFWFTLEVSQGYKDRSPERSWRDRPEPYRTGDDARQLRKPTSRA